MRLAYLYFSGLCVCLLLADFVYKQTSLRATHWRWHGLGARHAEHHEVAAVYISTSPKQRHLEPVALFANPFSLFSVCY